MGASLKEGRIKIGETVNISLNIFTICYVDCRRDKVSKKYGFKNYNVLDKRQFDLLIWNMMKSLSNNAEQVSSSSLSYHKDPK